MIIQNNNQCSFGAKFINTQSLHDVVNYAVENGKFDKLNKARKKIDCAYLNRRLKLEIFTTEDENKIPYVILTRYTPKRHIIVPKTMDDFNMSEPFIFTAKQKMNPLKFAFDIIQKLSNSAPKNNMYKKVVAGIKNK